MKEKKKIIFEVVDKAASLFKESLLKQLEQAIGAPKPELLEAGDQKTVKRQLTVGQQIPAVFGMTKSQPWCCLSLVFVDGCKIESASRFCAATARSKSHGSVNPQVLVNRAMAAMTVCNPDVGLDCDEIY